MAFWGREVKHPRVVHLRSGRQEVEWSRGSSPEQVAPPPESQHLCLECGPANADWALPRVRALLGPIEQSWLDLGFPVPELELRPAADLEPDSVRFVVAGHLYDEQRLSLQGALPLGLSLPETLQMLAHHWIRCSLGRWLGRDLLVRWSQALGCELDPSQVGEIRRKLIHRGSNSQPVPPPQFWHPWTPQHSALPPRSLEARQRAVEQELWDLGVCRELLFLWRRQSWHPERGLVLAARSQAGQLPSATLRRLLQRTLLEDPREWWADLRHRQPASARRLAQSWLERPPARTGGIELLQQRW